MVLPALRDSCLLFVCLFGTNKIGDFSAVRSLIELKLGGELGLVSQISVQVLVSRFNCFLYCKQTNKQNNAEIAKNVVLEKLTTKTKTCLSHRHVMIYSYLAGGRPTVSQPASRWIFFRCQQAPL
jgi:hypothetical protein